MLSFLCAFFTHPVRSAATPLVRGDSGSQKFRLLQKPYRVHHMPFQPGGSLFESEGKSDQFRKIEDRDIVFFSELFGDLFLV